MDTTQTLNTRQVEISGGTSSTVFPISLAAAALILPSVAGVPIFNQVPIDLNDMHSRTWVEAFECDSVTRGVSEKADMLELAKFAETVISNQKDIPSDFQRVIDRDFLSLV